MIPENLCQIKIKELRNLAKKLDIDVKDSNNKLKKKNILVSEIIRKSIEDDEEEEELYFPVKSTKKKPVAEDDEEHFVVKSVKRKPVVEDDDEELYFPVKSIKNKKQKKSVSFGNIPDNQRSTTKSTTRRPLTKEQMKTFIPRKAKRATREKLERQFMSSEDRNATEQPFGRGGFNVKSSTFTL